MKVRYIGTSFGPWKGLNLTPSGEYDIVPEYLQEIVARNENFELIDGADVESVDAVAEGPLRTPRKKAVKPVTDPVDVPVTAHEDPVAVDGSQD